MYDILFSMIDFIHNTSASKLEGSSTLRDLETSISSSYLNHLSETIMRKISGHFPHERQYY